MRINLEFASSVFFVVLTLGLAQSAAPEVALAYGGPGSVISGVGALLAALAALLASIFGFIWFPLKRLYHKMTEKDTPREDVAANSSDE